MPGDGPRDYQPPQFPNIVRGLPPSAKKVFLTVASVIVVATAVWFIPKWGLDMELSPPTVKKGALSGDLLTGTFTVHHAFSNFVPTKQAYGTGGACIVGAISGLVSEADAKEYGVAQEFNGTSKSCTSDLDCNPNDNDNDPATVQKWGGYCVGDPHHASQCWYKPVEDDTLLCEKSAYYIDDKKSLGPKPWPTDVPNPIPTPHVSPYLAPFDIHDFYREHTAGRAAQWMSIGCLNGDPFACGGGGGSTLRRYSAPVLIP